MNGALLGSQRADLYRALHDLSQPLTVVSLALCLAQTSTTAPERSLALEAAANECQRAMVAVRQLRSLLEGGVDARATLPAGLPAVAGQGEWIGGGEA